MTGTQRVKSFNKINNCALYKSNLIKLWPLRKAQRFLTNIVENELSCLDFTPLQK